MLQIKRLTKSFLYAFRGLIKVFKEEQNFQIQTSTGFIIIILGWYFQINKSEWLFLIIIIGLVLLMEILNSAVERVSDILKPRIHDYVKEIKDIMAAAVMLSSILAIIIGIIIFIPKIYEKIF